MLHSRALNKYKAIIFMVSLVMGTLFNIDFVGPSQLAFSLERWNKFDPY